MHTFGVRVRNSVPLQPINTVGCVGVGCHSWRADASAVQLIWYGGGGLFVSTWQVSRGVWQLSQILYNTSTPKYWLNRNEVETDQHHVIMLRRFCYLTKSVLQGINGRIMINVLDHQNVSLRLEVWSMIGVFPSLMRYSRQNKNFTGNLTQNQSRNHNNIPWNISPSNYPTTSQLTRAMSEVGTNWPVIYG